MGSWLQPHLVMTVAGILGIKCEWEIFLPFKLLKQATILALKQFLFEIPYLKKVIDLFVFP